MEYIAGNQRHFAQALNASRLGLRVLDMDSLYLAWIDCRGLDMSPAALEDHLLTKSRIWFDKGPKFGNEGAGFMRANLACPRTTVSEAVERLRASLP